MQNVAEDWEIRNKWNEFKRKVIEAASEVLVEKLPNRERKKITPWWTDEVRTIAMQKINCSGK